LLLWTEVVTTTGRHDPAAGRATEGMVGKGFYNGHSDA
jgi:hypothetical protein